MRRAESSSRTRDVTGEPLTDDTAGTIALGGDLSVRRMGYGAMRLAGPDIIGPPPDRAAAIAILRRAVELGVDLIDTADAYGPHHNETLIAEALRPYPSGLVIATKGGLVRDGSAWNPNGHPDHLRRACDASLERLGLDTIDLYQFHRPDPSVPFEESVGVLAELRDAGKIRLIGLSNVTVDQLRIAQGITPIASVQNRYNLRDRSSEGVLGACEADGIAFIPYFPLEGFGYTKGTPALEEIAGDHGATPAGVALAWLLARSPAMLPIPGTSSLAHLEENIAGAFLELAPHEIERLDGISTGASGALAKLARPLSPDARDRIRAASGPLRRIFGRLKFW